MTSLLVVSDIHYAGEGEQARAGHEGRVIGNPLLRLATSIYRRFIWLREPHRWNHLLDDVIARNLAPDLVVANGDFTVDSAFVGVSDAAAFASVQQCLGKLRSVYGPRLRATIGDHELGKLSLFGGAGGMRFASWERAVGSLGLDPVWCQEIASLVLIGVPSSLVALPLFAPELLPEDAPAWDRARERLWEDLRAVFSRLRRDQRVILFCHDPSALAFLHREDFVRARLDQLAATVVGHMHSPLVFKASRLLAGMPPLRSFGNTIRRISTALREARCWREFKVVLCPSLAGCELLKDGGYLTASLDPGGKSPVKFVRHRLPRSPVKRTNAESG